MFNCGPTLHDRLEHREERLERHLRQESERAKVDAKQRNIDGSGNSGGRQERSIAAQHNHEVERVRRHLCARHDLLPADIVRSLLIDDDFVGVFSEPGKKAGSDLRHLWAIWPRNDGGGFVGDHREKEIVQKFKDLTTEAKENMED